MIKSKRAHVKTVQIAVEFISSLMNYLSPHHSHPYIPRGPYARGPSRSNERD